MKLTGQADETTNGILFYETTNVRGQINYNHADQKMEFKTGDSNTLALTLASDQQATFSNHINLGDDVKALFGDSNDLQLYHNGTHSYINEAGTGNLIIYQGSNTAIFSPTSITLERDTTVSGDVNIKSIGGNNDPATLALWSPDVSIADNDNIGVILAQGSDSGGSPPYLGAKIEFNADAVWDTGTTGYYPTRIDFFTESNSGTVSTASPAFTIDSNQNATFAGTITATSASDNVAKFESSDAIARVVIEDSDSENNGNWIAVQNDVMSFATNGSNTALTLDSSQDATFAGNIVVSSGVIQLADLAQSIDFIQSGAINYDSNNDQTGRVFSIGHNRSAGSSGGTTNFVLDENSRISLSNNDGGSNNTVFGYKAGNAIASGTEGNVIIGHNAGLVLNGGDQNVAIGADALKAGTTGIGNTVVGTSAGDSATSQDNLVLIGKDAGGSINHIDSNGTTAIGTSALTLLTNGRQNTAVGYGALETTANGDRNTAVGHLALGNVTGGNDGDNTAIGHNAGHDGTNDLTDGTENTLIGSSTRVSSASAVNQTVIGYNAVGVGDNSVVLGDSDVTDVYMASDSGATVHCAKIQMLNYRIIQKDFGALSSGSSHDIGTANANFAGTIKMWTNHNSGSGYIEYSLVYSTNAKALSLIHQNQPYAPSTVTLSLDTSTGTISTSSLSYNTDVHIVIESMNTQFTFA